MKKRFNQKSNVRFSVSVAALVLLQACLHRPVVTTTESSLHQPRNDAMNDVPLPPNHNPNHKNTSLSLSAKRLPPPEIKPILLNGVLYTVSTSKSEDSAKSVTTLVATETNGQRRWIKDVYTIEFTPELETDVQEVYVSSMLLNENKDAIVIENESGQRFLVDIK